MTANKLGDKDRVCYSECRLNKKGVRQMTKKDYIKLANIVDKHTSITEPDRITRQSFINALCEVLEADNPSFDADRFITACK